MAIEIPAPAPADSEKVVTSLENAALFRRIGDHEEAVRWLQRAAELSGESGDDVRTLALARTAAELTESLRPGVEPPRNANGDRMKVLPKPPARSRPPESAAPPASAEPKSDVRASEAPRAVRPPPPSSRPHGSRPAPPSAKGLPAPSVVPRQASTAPSAPSQTPKPLAASQTPKPSLASQAPHPSLASQAPKPSLATQAPKPSAAHALRQAARVSVEKSATEPGLYLVRLLDDEALAPDGRSEALLVAVDPKAALF